MVLGDGEDGGMPLLREVNPAVEEAEWQQRQEVIQKQR